MTDLAAIAYTRKAVYVTGLPEHVRSAMALFPIANTGGPTLGIHVVERLEDADMLLVVNTGDWHESLSVINDINNAQRVGKPWALIGLGLRDLMGKTPPQPPRRRRVTVSHLTD